MKIYIAVFLTIWSATALAEVTPQSYSVDEHVQIANYDTNQVYRINAMQGYITSIQFSRDEKILSVNIGDSSSWLVSVQNEIINLKPTTDHPDTNLNVFTSRGTYQFLLNAPVMTVDSSGQLTRIPAANTVFLLRFHYPEQTKANANAIKAVKPLAQNWNYSARGNPEAAPAYVFDDGNFTYFYFSNHKNIPAIFAVDSGGHESIVNFHLENDFVTVETTGRQFTLRNGNQIASIFNEAKV